MGRVYKLNPQLSLYITWHAGVSEWKGRPNVNAFSFGIEMEHIPGQGWPEIQVGRCAELCRWLRERYGYLDITSHAAVARPKGRKTDPESFPWALFSGYMNGTED